MKYRPAAFFLVLPILGVMLIQVSNDLLWSRASDRPIWVWLVSTAIAMVGSIGFVVAVSWFQTRRTKPQDA